MVPLLHACRSVVGGANSLRGCSSSEVICKKTLTSFLAGIMLSSSAWKIPTKSPHQSKLNLCLKSTLINLYISVLPHH